MAFVVFIFVGVLWGQSGGLETPTIQFELTRAACEADRQQFLDTQATTNAGESPAFQEGYGVTPCYMVISEAGSKSS